MLPWRFWSKVRQDESGCWIWTAAQVKGYGKYGVRRGLVVMAHRYAYEDAVGPIPEGFHLHHVCATTLCVNPAHQLPISPTEHNAISPRRGRFSNLGDHCPKGHLYDFVRPDGKRGCSTCRREWGRAYKQRHLEEYRARDREKKRKLRAAWKAAGHSDSNPYRVSKSRQIVP